MPTEHSRRPRGPRRPAQPWLRGRTAAVAAVALAAAGAVTLAAGAPAARAATGTVVYVSPGADLTRALSALRAGDTLRLNPGVYDAGYVRPEPSPGTPTLPITVEAADPADRPLIRGVVKLWDADYWRVRNLRVQATWPGAEALAMGGGTGWTVSGSEFTGARATGGYANVSISNDLAGRPPAAFSFTQNCVHGAATTPSRPQMDHNIYVLFTGNRRNAGAIVRNVVFDHPNGEGIKLGVGGSAGTVGPWGVTVAFNTVARGGRQILLTGDVRYNTVTGNILSDSTQPFHADPRTTAVYLNLVATNTNVFSHNWFSGASMPWFDPAKKVVNAGDNALRPSAALTGYGSCTGLRPANVKATPYGRYGTGRY